MVTLTFHPKAWSCIVTLALVSRMCPCSGEMATIANYTDVVGVKVMTKVSILSPAIPSGPGHVTEVEDPRRKRDTGAPRTTPYTDKEKKVILSKHNMLRSGTKKAADMIMMKWDKDLEKESQMWADKCDFNHPVDRKAVGKFDTYGQNLYVSTAKPSPISEPVQFWYDEINDYTYAKRDSCASNRVCGHYTQIVWAKTYAVGCAMTYCDALTSAGGMTKAYYVVCNYGPAGNVVDHLPYMQGTACSKCPKSYMYCKDNLCTSTKSASADHRLGFTHRPYTLIAMVTASVWITVYFATGNSLLC